MEQILYIDDREKNVLRHKNDLKINCKTIRLTVGDYVMCKNNKICAVFERKTLEDYAASFKDGRASNIEKLVNLRTTTNCCIIYIIEGAYFPKPDDYFGNIAYKNIESNMFHLMMRYNVTFWRTKDTLQTAQFLVRFFNSMNTLKDFDTISMKLGSSQQTNTEIKNELFELEQTTMLEEEIKTTNLTEDIKTTNLTEDILLKITTKQEKSTIDIIRELWANFSGITCVSADNYIKWTIADIIFKKINLNEIKLNKRIFNSLNNINRMTEIKLLSTIPGISKITAVKLISDLDGLSNLLLLNKAELSILKINDTKKLGIKRAENITNYMFYKETQLQT